MFDSNDFEKSFDLLIGCLWGGLCFRLGWDAAEDTTPLIFLCILLFYFFGLPFIESKLEKLIDFFKERRQRSSGTDQPEV